MARVSLPCIFLLVTSCAGDSATCASERPLVTGCENVDEIRLRRDEEWSCVAVTEYPELQQPRVCAPENRFLPRIVTVKRTNLGDDGTARYDIIPSFSYDDEGRLKYEFRLRSFECRGGPRAVVEVHNRRVRTPTTRLHEFIAIVFLLVLLVFFCICAAAASDDSDGLARGVMIGTLFSGSPRSSKAHFE